VIGERRDVGWIQDIGSTIVGRLSSTPPTCELLDDRSRQGVDVDHPSWLFTERC